MPVKSQRPSVHVIDDCVHCGMAMEFTPTASITQVQCFACSCVTEVDIGKATTIPVTNYSATFTPPPPSHSSSPPPHENSKPQAHSVSVKDSQLYDALNIPTDATSDQIKKAYRKMAIRFHPDKNPDPNAVDQFKKVSDAYNVLSDPQQRDEYDRFGLSGGAIVLPGGESINPNEMFKQMFGGDAFMDYIGELSLGRQLAPMMSEQQQPQPRRRPSTSKAGDEESEKRQTARVDTLVTNTLSRINFFVHHPHLDLKSPLPEQHQHDINVMDLFKQRIQSEISELKMAPHGAELLRAIGYVYAVKARQREESFLGLSKFWNGLKDRGHVISSAVGIIRAAVDLQSTLTKLKNAEEPATPSATTTPATTTSTEQLNERKQKLEEQAATKGVHTMWMACRLEVESVIREVCDKILTDPNVTDDELRRRTIALRITGELYSKVEVEPSTKFP